MALEIAIFLGAVVVMAVIGVGIGMLVAPRLGRLAEDPDEEPRDDDRPDD